jgi:two-component system, NtrC family, sensor kinase
MANAAPEKNQPVFRYRELITYGVIFLALVATVFVLNFFISRDSQRDADQIFCATKQQEYWQKSYRSLLKIQERYAELGAVAQDTFMNATIRGSLVSEKQKALTDAMDDYGKSISIFGSTLKVLLEGGTLTLDGTPYDIAAVKSPKAVSIIDPIVKSWKASGDTMVALAELYSGTRKVDQNLLEKSVDFAIQTDDQILSSNRDFIVRLGELTSERIVRLQLIQIGALILSLVVFVAMAYRLAISLRKQAKIIQESQSQLIQNEKMASLGQMVAGLAHEMNTPLGFVRNNIEIIKENETELSRAVSACGTLIGNLMKGDYAAVEKDLPKTLDTIKSVEEVGVVDENSMMITSSIEGLDRIQELISNLKNFSRLDQTGQQAASINECLDSTLVIANHIIKRHMTVNKDYAKLPDIVCSPAQLNQVFLNIITNASHACEEKGAGSLFLKTKLEKDNVVVQISDNGKGIPDEVIAKIFDPFFTTKPVGKGTGLGLSISRKIIEEGHKGRIEVKSRLGHGTDFFIYLPIRSQNLAKEEQVFKTEAAVLN